MATITNIEDLKKIYKRRVPKMFYDYAKFKLGIQDENIKELINSSAEESDILLAIKEWLRLNSFDNKSILSTFSFWMLVIRSCSNIFVSLFGGIFV